MEQRFQSLLHIERWGKVEAEGEKVKRAERKERSKEETTRKKYQKRYGYVRKRICYQ